MLLYMLPMLLFMALMNAAFNHRGMTVLRYFSSGNPLTLESVVCGFAAGAMLISVILHFSCYNEVMTSDKFIYLFGKILPSLSLILSMTLRFVPRFSAQLKAVHAAQKCMGKSAHGSIMGRARYGLRTLSVMTTWALENAVDTADSMKARGYGISGRTAFSIYRFQKRDGRLLFFMLALIGMTLFGKLAGGADFTYFPMMKGTGGSPLTLGVCASYFMLLMCPLYVEIGEGRKWKASRSEI